MAELLEANPLPPRCVKCEEKAKLYWEADEAGKRKMEEEATEDDDFSMDCGSCDYAGDRFYYSREDELRIRKKGLQKAIERLQRQIAEIDKELAGEK